MWLLQYFPGYTLIQKNKWNNEQYGGKHIFSTAEETIRDIPGLTHKPY